MPKVSKKDTRKLTRKMIGGQSAFQVNPDKIIKVEDVDEIIRLNELPPLSSKHLITLSAFKKLRLEKPDMNIFNNQQSFYGKHQKCIDKGDTIKYQNSDGKTLRNIPIEVPWEIESPGYLPVAYTSSTVLNIPEGKKKHPWADPKDFNEPWENFQEYDIMNCYPYKKSFEGLMIIDDDSGKPLNPMGRTGLIDRGELGRWGCNYAADPVVIRKNNEILEMACINRKQDSKWAIPGGMVDPGDDLSVTLKKEFGEEAMASSTEEEIKKMFDTLKTQDEGGIGIKIIKGYVDDSRNTDNAWMETTAFLFYVGDILDNTNPNMHFIANLNLTGNPTEGKVSWKNIEEDSFVDQMFASHPIMVKQARYMVRLMESEARVKEKVTKASQGLARVNPDYGTLTQMLRRMRSCEAKLKKCQEEKLPGQAEAAPRGGRRRRREKKSRKSRKGRKGKKSRKNKRRTRRPTKRRR